VTSRLLLGLALFGGLTACARPPAQTASGTPANLVGYVKMDELVKKHPLYPQLSAYERSIEALSLREMGSDVSSAGSEIARQEAELQNELKDAADRTNRLLKEKQDEYSRRERAAIDAALAGANTAGPGAAQLAAGLNATASGQQASAAAQARGDAGKYRSAVIAQDKAATEALVKTYNDRGNRLYQDKANQLQAQEAQYSLQLAQGDAAQRLSLRTRLSNLALDDAGRKEAQAQLDALDKKEADALAAMRARDKETLAQYQTQLQTQIKGDLDKQVGALHGQTSAKLGASGASLANLGTPSGVGINPGKGPGPQASSAQLRAKLEALHKQYQDQFNSDAKQTIADFNKTRDDLERRFDQLRTADGAANAGAQAQLASLQKQHDDLYGQIVAQIQREVQIVAKNRGVSVVVTNVVAPGAGVDLTPDAEKEIESLHE
jgi:hypothetical protein